MQYTPVGYIGNRSYLANSCSRSSLAMSELTIYDSGSIKLARVTGPGLIL